MKLGAEGHRMDGEKIVGELEQDDLEEVAGLVWPDDEDLWRIGVGLEVDGDESVVDSVDHIGRGRAVTQRRRVEVHTPLS
jgi:hypothetical protein